LIRHPVKPRPYWLLGRVLEVVMGGDNIIRSVKLRQGDGNILHHSISNLYPLELSITHNPIMNDLNAEAEPCAPEVEEVAATEEDVSGSDNEPRRPVRQTALKCRKFIQDNLEHL
jgi:hypothetical protein